MLRGTFRVLTCLLLFGAYAGLVQAQEKTGEKPAAPKVEILTAYATIELPEKEFNFGEVLEGEQIVHTFIVKNKGTAPLEIKRVEPGARFMHSEQDAAVPPGGEGKITVKIDSSDQSGVLLRYLTVFTNDLFQPHVRIAMEGKIKPLIEILPGDLVTLSGLVDRDIAQTVDLKATEKPFRITAVETDLEGKISHRLETVEEGRHYRLTVKNTAGEGSYEGVIKLQTDLPAKSRIALRVKGEIKGLAAVLPQTVVVGKMSAAGEPRIGKAQLRRNVDRTFKIVKLTFDEKLLTVTTEALPDGLGYELTVTPKMENIPTTADNKGSTEMTVNILTDLTSEPYALKVVLRNTAAE